MMSNPYAISSFRPVFPQQQNQGTTYNQNERASYSDPAEFKTIVQQGPKPLNAHMQKIMDDYKAQQETDRSNSQKEIDRLNAQYDWSTVSNLSGEKKQSGPADLKVNY